MTGESPSSTTIPPTPWIVAHYHSKIDFSSCEFVTDFSSWNPFQRVEQKKYEISTCLSWTKLFRTSFRVSTRRAELRRGKLKEGKKVQHERYKWSHQSEKKTPFSVILQSHANKQQTEKVAALHVEDEKRVLLASGAGFQVSKAE